MFIRSICGFLVVLGCTSSVALAGVTTRYSGGDLIITADSAVNNFSVTTYWNGYQTRVLITGQQGTKIDGVDSLSRGAPSKSIVIEGPFALNTGDTNVRVHNIWGFDGNIVMRNTDNLDIENVWIYGDLILACPHEVSVYNTYARDIRSIHDYAAREIRVSYSVFSGNVNLYTRFLDLYDVEVGGNVWLYGTAGSDDHDLYKVTGRSYSQRPNIWGWMRGSNDYVTLRNCRASDFYLNGGSGSDTLYIDGRNNVTSRTRTTSVESIK